ncbi:hypothetical protein A21D_00210 [Virgibacillus dokdonensis]|uniref:Uncharacterized protein n=1 Tax=Virgibacillus dokdonensis TaxID=302167 RepID=A0A2K9IVC8_9BACI|nr:hypothetical protein A21D_00210 [Virgibacillus dokdonensis]
MHNMHFATAPFLYYRLFNMRVLTIWIVSSLVLNANPFKSSKGI